MEQVKFIITVLATAVYTSMWWALGIFGPCLIGWGANCTMKGFPLFIVLGLCTLGVFLGAIAYLIKNWDK